MDEALAEAERALVYHPASDPQFGDAGRDTPGYKALLAAKSSAEAIVDKYRREHGSCARLLAFQPFEPGHAEFPSDIMATAAVDHESNIIPFPERLHIV